MIWALMLMMCCVQGVMTGSVSLAVAEPLPDISRCGRKTTSSWCKYSVMVVLVVSAVVVVAAVVAGVAAVVTAVVGVVVSGQTLAGVVVW